MLSLICCVVIALTTITHAQSSDSTVVKTERGAVRGRRKWQCDQLERDSVCRPAGGKLRWRVPQPVVAWADVRDASKFGPACMQADDVAKSEDCLFLNIWRPAATSAQPFPVMF